MMLKNEISNLRNGDLDCVAQSEGDATGMVAANGAAYSFELEPVVGSRIFPAAGGAFAVTARLKIYQLGTLVSTQVVAPVITGAVEGFTICDNVVTAENRGTVIGTERSILLTLLHRFTYQEVEHTISTAISMSQRENNRSTSSIYIVNNYEYPGFSYEGGSFPFGFDYRYDSGATESRTVRFQSVSNYSGPDFYRVTPQAFIVNPNPDTTPRGGVVRFKYIIDGENYEFNSELWQYGPNPFIRG